MDQDKFFLLELESIREEYLNVKKCQHTFFIFEISATGAILSIVLPWFLWSVERVAFFHLFLLFAPALVIVPSLYIIFDKGITLNRIAGFLMVLEDVISVKKTWPKSHKGWERGCLEFRKKAHELEVGSGDRGTGTQGPNRFYSLVYWISVSLTIISGLLFLAVYISFCIRRMTSPDNLAVEIILILLIMVGILVFLIHTHRARRIVVDGKFTIFSMAHLWWKILEDEKREIFTYE